MTIFPRRVTCEPTDEEWPVLVQKGWTHQKFGRLHRIEFFTNREIVIGPVVADATADAPALFAKGLQRLTDLQEYLSPLAEGERSRKIPRPPENAGEFAGLSMREARLRAVERAGSRPQDLAVIEALYQFYQGVRR